VDAATGLFVIAKLPTTFVAKPAWVFGGHAFLAAKHVVVPLASPGIGKFFERSLNTYERLGAVFILVGVVPRCKQPVTSFNDFDCRVQGNTKSVIMG
jgi:hypothetical protein